MSYNSRLAQTGKRVASARRKYYGSFDYGSGIDARLRGGTFSFSRKHAWGGPDGKTWIPEIDETEVDEPDVQAMIAKYFRKHPNDAWKFGKNPETGLDYGAEFGDMSSGQTNWGGLATIGLGLLGSGIQGYNSRQSKSDALKQKYDIFGTNEFSGITDNNALLSTMANTQLLSGAKAKDFRDKTVGQDILSALSTGVNATVASGGNYWVGLGAAALDAGKSIWERFDAKNRAKESDALAAIENLQFLRDMNTASLDVDARNDWRRSLGYYNFPVLSAFGGPLHSNGGDYSGGLTFIDEGGRHEDNPYEGVPSGFDAEGNPNLVEEGEVIWNNEYVFSDRLEIPEELAKKYKLGGKKYTFAEAIEKLTKENTISPNDFITIATTKEIVNEFMDAQEAIREENQLAAKEELDTAQAQDFLAQLDAAQGMESPIGAPIDMGQMGMGIPNEAPVTEGEMMPPGYAFGGNKFDGGGWEDFFKMLEEYRGSLGASSLTGRYAIDRNAKYWNNRTAEEVEAEDNYGKFTKWVNEHKDDPNVQKYFEYLDKGINKSKGAKTLLKYDKDGKVTGFADDWEKTFNKRRTDKALGIYHLNPTDLAFLDAQKAPEATASEQQLFPDIKSPLGRAVVDLIANGTIKVPDLSKKTTTTSTAAPATETAKSEKPKEESPFKYRDTSLRYAPVIGSAMATLYGMLNRPDYTNADEVIKAARAVGLPMNIPVETIGDYRRRNPYDERYLVNLANQNRAAGVRTMTNTSGGNRSIDMLGAMALAHSNQYDLGEIMRQAYLANRQDDATVAEFNRGTNVQNMSAINQRNLTQAQLNSARQQAMLSGLERGYTMRQGIKDNWDDFTTESFESTLASLGAIGKENEEYNILTSMAEQGYFPYYYGDRSILNFIPYTNTKTVGKGGRLNRKKRRF